MNNKSLNENKTEMELMNVEKREAFALRFGTSSEWHKGLCEFGRKLFCAADNLSEGEFLGLELSVDQEGNCGGYVFSNAKEGMSAEDCQWFFQGLAEIAETDGNVGKLIGEQDCVYQVSEVSALELEKNEALRNKISDMKGACIRKKEQDQGDLVQMLQKTGARLFILFDATGTRFFACTKSVMTLGMRTLLTFIFPGCIIEEVSEKTPATERAAFSQKSALDMTASLLELFARKQFEKNRQRDYWDDSENFEFTDDTDEFEIMDGADYSDVSDDSDDYVPIGDSDDSNSAVQSDDSGTNKKDCEDPEADDEPYLGDSASLDDLELSVRSFNCLKRAGINTVGELRQMTDDELWHVRNLGRKSIDEIREKLAQYRIQPQSKALKTDNKSYFEMLDELIGLDAVKEQVRKLAAYAKLKKDMEERFLGNGTPIVLNMEFVGNPGTAKTTVARILAGILYDVGLLKYKDIVEVGRADLVAKYVGQTAEKVRDVFQRAKGRVLFIDEAYSLLDENEGSFGDEAITTIVQEMENHRSETVVIFAGYPKEMAEFIDRNPGLRSRVPFQIEFQDYSAEEMARIAEHETRGRGFSVAPEAMEKVLSICEENCGNKECGNGRFSRNLVEKAILNYASRVYGADREKKDDTEQHDFVLRAEDFSALDYKTRKEGIRPLGFAV